MKFDRTLAAALLAPGIALALWLGLGAAGLYFTLDEAAAAALAGAIGPLIETHGMLVVFWWLVGTVASAWAVFRLHQTYMAAPARLAEAAGVLVSDAAAPPVPLAGTRGNRALGQAVNALADERRALRQEMAALVDEASRSVARQRDQLGALLAELQQSVVVCNRDGRILLYNTRARALCRRLSRAPGRAAGAELIGLGRSIHRVIDSALIAHARETVARRVARGEPAPSARFVTHTPSGHLLRVSFSPMRGLAEDADSGGFVLLLDDITEEHETATRQDRLWQTLMETGRAAAANIQIALDMLDYPDLEPAERERFQQVVREEVAAMSTRVAALAGEAATDHAARWPLQDMQGSDLISAVAHAIGDVTGKQAFTAQVDPDIWLRVDSFALVAVLASLARRSLADRPQATAELRLSPAGGRAHLDLVIVDGAAPEPGWQGMPAETVDGQTGPGAREVAERHGGEVWLEHEHGGAQPRAVIRFLLPLAVVGGESLPLAGENRPEFYDFALFAAGDAHGELHDRALDSLSFTVFDTETTGLNPAGGDEIIEIGATRIVNGKLLRAECFDQLVDPGRSIPEAGIAIHGIRPDMVRGQPAIAAVLPVFHAFVADTVLVGHNVAFDLRFLKLKEAATGVIFSQPVLDTLLLASVVHPNAEGQSLEAIAARLGVSVSDRHRALGDAMVCAQVFLKLVPLLRQQGIRTLGEALAASEDSYYARLRY